MSNVEITVGVKLDDAKAKEKLKKLEESSSEICVDLCLHTEKFQAELKKFLAEMQAELCVDLCLHTEKFQAQLREALQGSRDIFVSLELNSEDFERELSEKLRSRRIKIKAEVESTGGEQSTGGGFVSSSFQLAEEFESLRRTIANTNTGGNLARESIEGLKNSIGAVAKTALFPIARVAAGAFEGIGREITRSFGASLFAGAKRTSRIDENALGNRIGDNFARMAIGSFGRIPKNYREKRKEPQEPQEPQRQSSGFNLDNARALLASAIPGLSQFSTAINKVSSSLDKFNGLLETASKILKEIGTSKEKKTKEPKTKEPKPDPTTIEQQEIKAQKRKTKTKKVAAGEPEPPPSPATEKGFSGGKKAIKKRAEVIPPPPIQEDLSNKADRRRASKAFSVDPDVGSTLRASQKSAIENYLKIFAAVIQESGLDPKSISKSIIPKLRVSSLRPGIQAAYDPQRNQIEIPSSLKDRLHRGAISKKDIELLAHEIRHSLQFAFGKLDLKNLGKSGLPLDRKLMASREVSASVSAFKEERKRSGTPATDRELKAARLAESDATAFAKKFAASKRAEELLGQSLAPFSGKEKTIRIFASQVFLQGKLADRSSTRLFSAAAGTSGAGAPGAGAPRSLDERVERSIRRLEILLIRNLARSAGVSPRERRNLASQASGFVASAGTLVAPGFTLTALASPLIAAFAPLIATIGAATLTLSPFISSILATIKALEPLQRRFESIGGSKEKGTLLEKFASQTAAELNIPIFSAIEGYSKLAAATKGTRLEGEKTDKLFKAISVSSKALSLSSQDASLVFLAFTQILSKGKFTAEELRQQLAERFPGVIQVLARSLNVTTRELNKLLESGSLDVNEVIPKFSSQLILEYGQAARDSANLFIDGTTKIENAIFKVRATLARTFAPIFGGIANAIGASLEAIANNTSSFLEKVGNIYIGVLFQFGAGLSVIISQSKAVAKAFAFITPIFKRVFAALVPFLSGFFADAIADIGSAIFQSKVPDAVDSIMSAVNNLIEIIKLLVILVISNVRLVSGSVGAAINTISEGINNLLGVDVGFFGGFIKDLGAGIAGISEIFKSLFQGTGAFLTRVAAIYVVVSQLIALFAINSATIAQGVIALKALSLGFIQSARSGKVLQSVMKVFKATFTDFQFQLSLTISALILFFSTADFSNPLLTSLEKSIKKIEQTNESLKTLKATKDKVDLGSIFEERKSKGFDLTMGIGSAFGGSAFRTDDLIKAINKGNREYNKQLKDAGKITQEAFERRTSNELMTLADSQFAQLKIAAFDFSNAIQDLALGARSTLELKNFKPEIALKDIKGYSVRIADLRKRRISIALGGDKKAKEEIDEALQQLVDERDRAFNLASIPRSNIVKAIQEAKDRIKEITENSDLTQADKDTLLKELQVGLKFSEEQLRAIDSRLESAGIKAKSFSEIARDIADSFSKSNSELNNLFQNLDISKAEKLTDIQERLNQNRLRESVGRSMTLLIDTEDAESRVEALAKNLKDLQSQKLDILSLPNTEALADNNKKQLEEINNEIQKKSLDLANARLNLAKAIGDRERENGSIALEALEKLEEAILRRTIKKETSVIQSRGSNKLTEEEAKLKNTDIEIAKIRELINLRSRQIELNNRLSLSGQIGIEEGAQKYQKLLGDLANLEKDLVSAQIERQADLKAIAEDRLNREIDLRTKVADVAIQGIETEKNSLDAINSKLELTKNLLSARAELLKAKEDFKSSGLESELSGLKRAIELREKLKDRNLDPYSRKGAKEELRQLGFFGSLNSLRERQKGIESEINQSKASALIQEQSLQQALLKLEIERNRIAGLTALEEAKIAELKAKSAFLSAKGQLGSALIAGDKNKIQIALLGFDIAAQELALSQKQIAALAKKLKIEESIASLQLEAQAINQKGEKQRNIREFIGGFAARSFDRAPFKFEVPSFDSTDVKPRNFLASPFAELPDIRTLADYQKFRELPAPKPDLKEQPLEMQIKLLDFKIPIAQTSIEDRESIVKELRSIKALLAGGKLGNQITIPTQISNTFDDSKRAATLEKLARDQSEALFKLIQDSLK